MGIVRGIQKGEADPSDFNKDAQDAAKKMKKSSVKKYAKTKHKGLPLKKESMTAAQSKAAHKKFKETGELPPHLKKLFKDLDKVKTKHKVTNVVVPGLEWMSKLGEAADRDYKAEYKKFQSSTKSKKYRAELNKYNRKKGTYGNGDGKDASHKGGKIVGFEKESVNRGRAEKSRLKKEANMPDFNPMIDKALDEVIEEYTMNRKGVIDKIATLAKANKYGTVDGTQMNGKSAKEIIAIYNHPKMKKFKKAMADYTVDDFVNLSIKLKKVLGIKVNENTVKFSKADMGKLHKDGEISKKDPDGKAHKYVFKEDQLRSAFSHIMNESIDCLCEACWKGYEKKGMKTMFGKQYPNCVKKTKKEGLGDRMSKVSKKYAKGQKKSKKALKNKKGPYQEGVNEVSDKQKRKIYKKAFGKEYDDPKRKQAPLPLDIAYKVALNRLKKKEGVNEAFAIQYKKDKRYLTRKELFDKKPLKFKTEDEAKSMLNGLDYKYRTNYKIVKIKEGVNENSAEKSKILKLMIKRGDNPKDAKKDLEKHYKKAKGDRSKATPSQLAQYIGYLGANESVNEGLDKRQAGETLKQLGGNKFIAMTGAKNFTVGKEGLAFKIGRNAKAVNYVVIQLNGKDLYDMKFQKGTRVLKTANDVYGDQLQKMFTKYTGMYTSL